MPLIALLVMVAAALLLLAAHLVHGGFLPLAGLAVCSIALLAVPRSWAARTLQVLLGIATIEWTLTTYVLAHLRAAHDQPYMRLVLILGTVTVFTAFAALVFELTPMRRRFGMARARTIDP